MAHLWLVSSLLSGVYGREVPDNFAVRDMLTYFVHLALPYMYQKHSPDPFKLLPGLAAVFQRESLHDAGGPSLSARRKPPAVLVDVGAWAGDVTAQFMQHFTDLERRRHHLQAYGKMVTSAPRQVLGVLSFEPDPTTFQTLRQRAKSNHWHLAGFCGVQAAASDAPRDQLVAFRSRVGFSQDSQLDEEKGSLDADDLETNKDHAELRQEPLVHVPVHSLDSWLLDGRRLASDEGCPAFPHLRVDGDEVDTGTVFAEVFLLKVDAQGHDDLVLRGARRMFEAGLIRFVIFEYGGHAVTPASGRDLFSIVEMLYAYGLVCFMILDSVLIPVSGVWWMDAYDAPGNTYVGHQSSDFFCGGLRDPGLDLVFEMFVGSRFAPHAKRFVKYAMRSLKMNPPQWPAPGRPLPPLAIPELHAGHLEQVEDGYTRLRNQGDSEETRAMLARVCLELGDLYKHGYGARPNVSAARHWYTLASKEGSAEATLMLGVLAQFHGHGPLERRRDISRELYLQAAEEGHSLAGFVAMPLCFN